LEDVEKICIDFDFNDEAIEKYLTVFEADEKYKNLPAYEW